MPTFSEHLFAPWKVFPLLLDNPVARVGGYEMPAFILWASFGIAVLFALSSARLLRQARSLSRDIEIATASVAMLPGTASLADIGAAFSHSAPLSIFWNRLRDSLVQPTGSSPIYSTSPIEQNIPRDELIEESVSTSYFNALPGVLTGLGLLMTFIAILEGLSHVSVSATMDVSGIGGLINGLSGKFVSSIVAVSCAVLFVFVERVAYSLPVEPHRRLTLALAARFKRRTTEHLLLELQSQLSTHALLLHDIKRALKDPDEALPIERPATELHGGPDAEPAPTSPQIGNA